ncbi:hypothetical protein Fmac_019087 [Flemingia macrophylla]|uniref:non-specific serine/threonine protein kinase n=1 Tax=Flemingia macrophylla TaxID=520843 RepID=A0ABD1M6U8_9FABA
MLIEHVNYRILYMDSYEVMMMIVLWFLLFSLIPSITAVSIITPDQPLPHNKTLVSASGTFEAGFFGPGSSQRHYFCIFYKNISPRTIVWVANRNTPLDNSTGVFRVSVGGNLLVLDGTGEIVWSSNASNIAQKPVVQLLDSGNLVVKDGAANGPEKIVWQSFDYPGDTLLPGMKLKASFVTGVHNSLTSWRDLEDPALGEFSLYIDPHGFPQRVITTKGGTWLYRAGSWNGYQFSGVPWNLLHNFFNYYFVLTQEEVYYEYELIESSVVTRFVINPGGLDERFTWSERTKSWELFASGPRDQCENYALCGANSVCNMNSYPICECLEGFLPKFREKWRSLDWSDGCARRTNLSCDNEDEFVKYEGMRLPDTSSSWFDTSMSLDECKRVCLKNCSCTAYTSLDVRDGGSGCLLWFGNIVDMGKHASQGQDVYIRMAASEIGKTNIMDRMHHSVKHDKKDIDLPILDLSTIDNATSNFSISNMLGEGGFGPVYKGVLTNGQEIAVKRLSKTSGQGLDEFRNEVVLIANLQHRNLVKILGCCVQDEERILIYEFVPNRSLDLYIFEYAAYGSFSVKSDVFSFGVIILEIISGKKNTKFLDPLNQLNLLGHALTAEPLCPQTIQLNI